MHAKLKYTLLALFAVLSLHGQNLVLNPGFEQVTVCPSRTIIELDTVFNVVKDWHNPTLSSPDIFHICVTSPLCEHSESWSVPNSGWGFQYPIDSCHAGILIGSKMVWAPAWREYITGTLSEPLQSGRTYCINAYVSPAELYACIDSMKSYGMAAKSIGAYLSSTFNKIQTETIHPETPQIELYKEDGGYIADSTTWTLVSGTYIAQGGEKYITLGNFKSDALTDLIVNGDVYEPDSNNFCYYYIDNVSITKCSGVGLLEIPYNINIYPNPAQDFVSVKMSKNVSNAMLNIYNLTGQLISQKQITQSDQTIPITELDNGVYIFVIQNEDTILNRQRIIIAK